MQKSDRLSALFFIGLSLFVCQQSTHIGLGTLWNPGAGLMPFGAGASVGLLALGLLGRSLLTKEPQIESEREKGSLSKGRFLLICTSLFVYAIAVQWLGFVLSTFLFVLLMLGNIESETWWRILIKAVLITTGNYLIFVTWLGISLPKGFFDW
ncbi:MAG: tripartite tricarboxylate transporter TctB family protein [Pseudomonadota bacterium]